MRIPPGHTEATVLEAIQQAADLLGPAFAFGYYDEDDIRQECYVEAIKLLEKDTYDPARPLPNYIYTHLKRRLINLKRNKLRRCDPPCRDCHAGYPCEDARGEFCSKYATWRKRNDTKSSLMKPVAFKDSPEQEVVSAGEDASNIAELAELMSWLDEDLTSEQRLTWLQIRDGLFVPKPRRLELEAAIRELLEDAFLDPSEEESAT